jgi:hypothetical protein
MATARKPFGLNDRGKKHDDPGRRGGPSRLQSMFHSLITVRKRRVILILLAVWLLYLFVKNIPTDLPPVSQRVDRYGQLRPGPPPESQPPAAQSVQEPVSTGEQYDGPVKFFKLGRSLRGFETDGKDNVLFAFSSMESSSHVLTSACAMARNKRMIVNVAAMGRKEVPLPDLLAVNKISLEECPIRWHEAQPDFALQSSADRMQMSCEAAVGHISRVLRLRANFFDDSDREDGFLRKGMKHRVKSLGLPLLDVPKADSWMLELGVPSLKLWNQVQIDILVHVSRDAVGSLMRLLRTIQAADYRGLPYPRITIELPSNVDGFIFDHLGTFSWPPGSSPSESLLTVRHRPDSKLLTPAMASTRFVESFYPARAGTSHVLVLSENAELASNYFQFLHYMLMEYHYGGSLELAERRMVGFSLTSAPTGQSNADSAAPVSFHQKPTADAALYFGEEWIQLHQFISHRLYADPELSRTVDAELETPDNWPSWLRITMEWMRLQGLYMGYANLPSSEPPLVTLHSELHEIPEELNIQREAKKTTLHGALKLSQDKDVLLAEGTPDAEGTSVSSQSAPSLEDLLSRMPKTDGAKKGAPVIGTVYSYDGRPLTWAESNDEAEEYAKRYAKVVGKCSSQREGGSLEKDGYGFFFCNEPASTKT